MICPKCNHKQPDGELECRRCGIIFSKYTNGKKSSGNQIVSFSNVYCRKSSFFETILWPVVKVKDIIEEVYDYILGMIWEELLGSKNEYNQLTIIFSLLIFLTFSFFVYEFGVYSDLILMVLFIIWLVDYMVAKYSFMKKKTTEQIIIRKSTDGKSVWGKKSKINNDDFEIAFNTNEVKQISVKHTNRLGGVFQEMMGPVWEVNLTLNDGVDLITMEEKNAAAAMKQAQKLSEVFDVSIKFSNSYGNGVLSSNRLGREETVLSENNMDSGTGTIMIENDQTKSVVFSKWNLMSIRYFLKTVLHESGFFLFLLIMIAVMNRFGEYISWYIAPYIGMERTTLYIQLCFSSIIRFFKPELDWIDLLEFLLAIGVMIFSFLKLCKRKYLCIDSAVVRFVNGREKPKNLETKAVRLPVFITEPEPMILIMDNHDAIEVKNFQLHEELVQFLIAIEQGIRRFRKVENRKKC